MRKAIILSALLTLVGLALVQTGCSKDEEKPADPPPACSIVLDQFNSWDYYFTGDEINIRWAKTTGGNVMIQLFKGPNPVGVISPETKNTGFYPWLQCSTFGQASGEDFSIKVTSLDDGNCWDQTNTFEMIDVSNCFIKFPWTDKYPIETQTAGESFNITWDSDNTSGTVKLELWYEPFNSLGILVGVIADNLADDGSFDWTVDTFNRGTDEGYRIKIYDLQYDTCRDRSVPFKIIDEEICSIEVMGVNQGYAYTRGDNIPLTFTMDYSSGVVKLKLYSGNNLVNDPPQNGVITERFDTDNGTAVFNWAVSDLNHSGPAYNRFNIRAFDVDDESCVGISSDFAITQ